MKKTTSIQNYKDIQKLIGDIHKTAKTEGERTNALLETIIQVLWIIKEERSK